MRIIRRIHIIQSDCLIQKITTSEIVFRRIATEGSRTSIVLSDRKKRGTRNERKKTLYFEEDKHNLNLDYIKELIELGYSDISPSVLVDMKIHHVTTNFIKDLKEMGFEDITPRQLVEMKIHNVDPKFIDEMKEFGYDRLSRKDLIEMNIHGVDAHFVRDMHDKGIKDLSIRRLIKIKIHGIFD